MSDQSRNSSSVPRSGARRAGLGRGLEALIPNLESTMASSAPAVSATTAISNITPNPRQPRSVFDQDELAVLAESIRLHGVIQPVVVKPTSSPDNYVLIAGERRWRAAQLAGLEFVPIVIMDVSQQAQLELALVENVIRTDLSPLEEATAYRELIDEFGLTQAEVADRVGRSRVSVTNTLRLLALPDQVKIALQTGEISEGHARALLGLPSAIEQVAMLESVLKRHWSVRETENAVRAWVEQQTVSNPVRGAQSLRSTYAESEQRLRRALATNVSINRSERGTGTIRIDFASDDQLAELLDRIAGESLY